MRGNLVFRGDHFTPFKRLQKHPSKIFPVLGFIYFPFPSLIMFAASQAFQKTAGQFILYPNTLQHFGGRLSLAGHEKLVANQPWLHLVLVVFPQQFAVALTVSPGQTSTARAFSTGLCVLPSA